MCLVIGCTQIQESVKINFGGGSPPQFGQCAKERVFLRDPWAVICRDKEKQNQEASNFLFSLYCVWKLLTRILFMRRPKKGMRPQAKVVTEQEAETFWMEIFNIILCVFFHNSFTHLVVSDLGVDDDAKAEVDGNVVVNFEKDEKQMTQMVGRMSWSWFLIYLNVYHFHFSLVAKFSSGCFHQTVYWIAL